MPKGFRQFLIMCSVGLCATLVAADVVAPANWDRGEATRAAALTDTFTTRESLKQLVMAGSGTDLLALVEDTASRKDWPGPARESVLYSFTEELRTLPPGSVAPEVMEFLGSYRSQVLVTDEDHPHTGVPLFNVRATAHGVENTWKRQKAAYAGAVILNDDPLLLVEAYRHSAGSPERQGLLDALATATVGQLEAVSFLALAGLEQEPQLVALAGQAALLNGDARALEQLVRTGRGSTMSHILRQSADVLTGRQLARLFGTAVQEGSPETASLAIAILAPVLAGQSETEDVLLNLLGDPALGSTAALALAKNPSIETLRRLDRMAAAGDDSLHSARARMALDINREQFAREVRP